ncbi:interleukin-27 receptor subunit alpha [Zootoca vivipara]|uniref:interleukin-27 receptor subunit alpha n=1 Tax=Zootoca vivipara TaxID=8524 RepID=UPI00293B8A4F|nr:interleukin-27 receptor subunit alpha [Zootoca vivipara]
MGNRGNAAWLLLLSLKVFGMKKGDPDAPTDLKCYQSVPSNIVNCSWSTREPPDADTTHVLYYKSLKFHPGNPPKRGAVGKQNWLLIEKGNMQQGDNYSVWVETNRSTAGIATSAKLNFSLDEIVKPPPPDLEPVEFESSVATVRWTNPQWSESLHHQALTCALRYKMSKDHSWTYLSEEHVEQAGHDLEDLKPFTSYEVQVQCIPDTRKGFWSEWSSSQTFVTPEAAPLGQVDVWQKVGVSEKGVPSRFLLWKVPDPEAARGIILDYKVVFQDRDKNITTTVCLCCHAALPLSANYAWVSARNSVKSSLPANLSLEQADLPGPEEVEVMALPGLGPRVMWKPSASSRWLQPEEYVVEWREEISSNPAGQLLNWTRSPRGNSSALLRGDFRAKVPYLVCVYAVYAHGSSASVPVRAYFKEGAPTAAPQALQERSISPTASLISWEEIPLGDRNGHITRYTLYLGHPTLRNAKANRTIAVGAAKRSYSLSDLMPGTSYQLCMTGSTSAGEGVPSPVHHFRTPDSHWWTFMAAILFLGFLLFLAFLVVLVNYRWVLDFCRKILPPWCWEKIPDPGHSGVTQRIHEHSAAPGMDALSQCLAKFPEEIDIVEIKEPAPEQTMPLAPVEISGYEKRFMPTLEELERLA